MAFSAPNNYTTATALTATAWQENCDDLRVYLDKIESTAISASAWVKPQHIMKPVIYGRGGGQTGPEVRHGDFASVVLEGAQIAPKSNIFTFSSAYNTSKLGGGSLVELPRTSVTLDVRYPGDLSFQWWCYGITRGNADAVYGNASLYCYKGTKDANSLSTLGFMPEETAGLSTWPTEAVRYNYNGFEVVSGLTSGTYTIGLTTKSDTAKTVIYAWGFLATLHHI
tara:strand:+ start:304 stop:978 length:675 start_codon:yes stop_codon:yes gene_type:complete